MIKWSMNLLVTVFCTMVAIYIIKSVSIKYDIPFMKKVAQAV